MIFRDTFLAGSTLVREAIQSFNYATGVSGWRIAQDGTAEFNNVTIRGGTQVSGTALYYDGTPGYKRLLLAIAPVAGTDIYGNTYQAGINLFQNGVVQVIAGFGENSIGNGRGTVTSYLYNSPDNNWFYSALTAGIIELGMWDTTNGYESHPSKVQYSISTNTLTTAVQHSLWLQSGNDVGVGASSITLTSESATVGNDSSINLGGDSVKFNGIDQGKGIVGSATLSSDISFTNTETPVMNTDNITWENGRVYRVDMDLLLRSNTASGFFNMQLRKGTNTITGNLWRPQMRVESIPTNNGLNRYASFRVYFTPTTTFTSGLCLTAAANGSTVGTLSGNSPSTTSYLNVMDVGANNTPSPFTIPTYAGIPIS